MRKNNISIFSLFLIIIIMIVGVAAANEDEVEIPDDLLSGRYKTGNIAQKDHLMVMDGDLLDLAQPTNNCGFFSTPILDDLPINISFYACIK